jgi:lysozyme
MLVNEFTLHWVEQKEGQSLKAYLDARNIWTIGIGMTTLNGRPVRPADVINQKQMDQIFGSLLQYCQNNALGMINPVMLKKLNLNQITAIDSLAYNIGLDLGHVPGSLGFSDSMVLKKLNHGDFQGAADAFRNWERVGNDRNLLAPRREAERSLFLS